MLFGRVTVVRPSEANLSVSKFERSQFWTRYSWYNREGAREVKSTVGQAFCSDQRNEEKMGPRMRTTQSTSADVVQPWTSPCDTPAVPVICGVIFTHDFSSRKADLGA